MYLRTFPAETEPMVSQKYEPFHNCPRHKEWRSSGNSLSSVLPLIPFRYFTINVGESLGGAVMKQCTWSFCPTLHSSTEKPFAVPISRSNPYSRVLICGERTFLRYLTHQTIW